MKRQEVYRLIKKKKKGRIAMGLLIYFLKFPFKNRMRCFFSILLSGVLEKQHLQPS